MSLDTYVNVNLNVNVKKKICHNRFVNVTSLTRVCISTGQRCSTPPNQTNGHLDGLCSLETKYGSHCSFVCNDGYELRSPLGDIHSHIECVILGDGLNNGVAWNSGLQACQSKYMKDKLLAKILIQVSIR